MTLTYSRFATPLGDVRLARCEDSIVGLAFDDAWPRVERALVRRYGTFRAASASSPDVAATLRRYFEGAPDALAELSIDPGGTPFQRAVWAALQRIPAGRTTFYGAIARAIGAPGAARAVGAACGANPIWLVIPCHRAIGNDGQLVGYAGGIARKRWLLAHEGALPCAEPASTRSAVAFAQR
ncbi:MAG: methylated-DNA--[protein]-cysteine S-methyltransferase [Deltaproteobacteria bacterium]|nr:methylated-DNA--[protein]-cysteine S-methyltransferase [Deltaproteobacteria bacterium]